MTIPLRRDLPYLAPCHGVVPAKPREAERRRALVPTIRSCASQWQAMHIRSCPERGEGSFRLDENHSRYADEEVVFWFLHTKNW